MVELAVIVATIAAKVASCTIGPIGRYIVRPIASRCPFKNLWEYKSNLENMKTKIKNLEAERERVHGLTNVGVEPLPDISDWLDKATNIINEVSGLISEDNPERGCCEGCTYSNLKESYQHRNDVARMLKDVAQLLQEALRSISLWEYKSNLENLKKEVEKLEAKRDSVKCSIKAGEEPLPDVKLWQDKVNSMIDEVSGLTSQHNHHHQNYVARILNNVAQLLQQVREFKKLSFQPIPEETWLQSSESYKAFESRTSILKEIVEALSTPDVNLVGIYGMGGIGKTTLSKQVARQTIQDKVFNKVVFVEVSQTPNIKKIQREIGSKLGLDFREEEELSERARRLYQQLKDEEKTLLILDNVWESLNFETMGIPYKHDRKGLKLLMTARKNNVLTDGIENSQHNFGIEALEWEDAWSLFKSKAGTCVDRRDLLPIAVDVAKECGGVPIAIVTIAKALNNKETFEWRKVLRELRNPSPDSFDGIAANVYRSIELSYNYLETEELKATFLLCSSMGSTYDASIEDLLRYGIGLGLFNRFNTMEEERDNVCSLISTLKASSLLVDVPKSEEFFYNRLSNIERFAMHDIVCYVGRSIACKESNVFKVIDNVIPRSWESENILTNCTSITLDNVSELSKDLQLVCPQLKFLYVKPKFFDAKISDKFFACMPKLQVLHLIEMDLLQLSTPFSDLVNLQTLCLEYCELKDMADVEELKNLEIFSFRGCNGFQLSEKLHQLTKLRLLELDYIGLSSIPSKFILSFKKLEALYMRGTTIEWEAEKSNNGSRNTSLDELEHLSNLSSLEIYFPEIPEAIMLRGLLFPKLERYKIIIGENRLPSLPDEWSEYCCNWYIQCKTSRFLQVKLNTNEDGIISELKAIRQLVFDEVPGIADNFCGLDRIGFPELEDLKVQNNSHILHIVDTVSCEDVFPILKSLILWNLINLKTICNGPLGMKLFHQLRTIKVGKCIQLINIFSLANDRVFQELEEIEVFSCCNMEEIFAISDQVHEIKFSKLRNLRLASLPKLESFCCNLKTTTPILQLTSDTKPREIILEEEQDVPKPLFNEKVVVTNLETLEINDINIDFIWDNQLSTTTSIPNLTCLIISNLANLRRLGSGDYIKFPLLRIITIQNCPKFKEICLDDKVGVPSLEHINISKMDNLKMIWHNQLIEDSFPKLKSLRVKECQKLSILFQSNMYGRFLSLETLNVSKCGSLKEILDLRDINSEESQPTTSTQSRELCTYNSLVLSFSNLQNLKVSKCRSLKTVVAKEEVEAKEAPRTSRFVFPKLTSLVLHELPELRIFCPDRYTTEWPLLETLETYQCWIHGHTETTTVNQNLSLLLNKVVVTNLKTLEINDINVDFIWDSQLPTMASIPNLTCLIISNLANLRRLGSGDYIKFPLLRIITIENCPKFKEFLFDDKVGFPSLEHINILKMYNLKMIWHNQLVEDSFPKLKSLRVEKCWELSTLFQSNMCGRFLSLETLCVSECFSLKEILDLREINYEESHPTTSTQSRELCTYSSLVLSFAKLQFLEVSKCGSLKTIVAKEEVEAKEVPETARFAFPKLTFLELYDLRALKTFYPGRYTMECPVLRTLKINQYGTHEYTEMMRAYQNIFLLSKVRFEFQVQKIWPNLLPIRSSWVRELTMLILHDCDNLEELFSYSMVVKEELREKKIENIIVFPTLNYLEINQLANLKGLCSGCYIEFPTLKGFKISNCPELTTFIFDDKVKVPSLKNAEISSMGKLTKIWDNQLAENFVPKLKSLQVERCQKLLILLPSDMCESFSCLETLNVSGCGSLEKIFDLHEINSKERHSTTSTQSKELYTTVLSFANLQNLKVSECGSLKSLFSVSNTANDRGAVEETHVTVRFVFPKLISLELLLLREFRTFYPGRYTMECPVLKTWKMYQSGIHSYTAMKKLEKRRYEICGDCEQIPKTMIGFQHLILWDDKVDFDFQVQKIWPNLLPIMSSWVQNLNRLILHCCDNLEELFPYSMVVTEELREKKMGKTIVFPMLNYLQMKRLANLKRLCSRCHIEFPTLEEFKISNCPELMAFIFDDKVKVPSLKKVKISSMDKLTKIWDNQFAENFIPKLKSLQVKRCQKLLTLLPSDMYESLSSLETLNVSDCGSLEKIFDLHEINSEERYSTTSTLARELYTTVLSFTNLQNLKVSECGSLKSLFSVSNVVKDRGAAEETHATARFVFPKLTFLELYKLPELRTFYPARYIVEWPALRSLKVCDYGISDTEENKSMQRVFPYRDRFATLCKMDGHIERIWLWLLPMMSSSFQNLKELVIYECGNLKELFPTSNLVEEKLREKEIGNTISFPRLECLVMEYLANLTRLCSEYYNIKFPLLKECKIRHCPELKAFIFDHKVKVPSLEKVKISSMDKLTKIWDNQFAENFIPKLKSLQVKRCQKLLTLLPSDMCESLSNLETLNVSNCGSLEKIFDLYEINSEERYSTASTQSKELYTTGLSFANLQNLKISECGSMKSLFSVSNIANDKGVAEETHATARFVFPKLTLLELYKLPELRTFYPARYTVEWPALKSLELCDCGISEINIEERHSMTSTQSKELYTTVLSFANLQNLKVSKCGSMKSLFSVLNVAKNREVVDCGSLGKIFELHETNSEERHSATSTQSKELYAIVLSFANLQNLKVSECASLKSLFSVSNVAKERGVAEEMDATTGFIFPKLTSLELCKLPELKTFYPARYTVEWPALRSLKLCDCGISETDENNLLQRYLICQTDQFPILRNTDGLKIYIRRIWFWLRPIMSSSFQNLKELVIYDCGNLKELFPSSNPIEEELREKEMGNTISFPMLECLNIGNLANLTRLCSGYYNIEFPSLKECEIYQCPKLEAFIFDHKVKVPSLKNVNISYMDKLTKVWDNQLAENSIPKLESLQVYGCHKVLILLPLDKCESLSSLETLNVSDCGSLEKIFDLHEINSEERHSTTSTQSKELYTTVLSFANLQNLKVSKCGSLKSLFSVPNVAKDREAAEETHATARFVFPKLTSLVLYNLPELRTFYPARYTVEWPVLRWLGLRDCGISETDENNLLQRWSCSCLDKFSRLWNTDGFEIHVERIWQRLLPMTYSSFQNLTKLAVYDCGNLIELFPSSYLVEEEFAAKIMGNTILFPKLECLDMENLANLTRLCSGYYTIEFPSLKECKINLCPKLEAFIFDHKVKVPSLKNVKISSMDNLMKIWDNQLVENSIPKLESLQVYRCHKVLTLLPSDNCESLSSLETLNVSGCDSLEKIFDLQETNSEERHSTTSTQSKELYTTVFSFANLQNLKVSECRSLKSLFSILNVAKNRGAAEETHPIAKFVFPKLTTLELYNLPEFRTFYPRRYTVEWPVLRRLWLCDGISDTDDEDRMQNSLFLVEKAVSSLGELMLSGRQLMMMWQGQDPEPLLRNFKVLAVLDQSIADHLLNADQPVLGYVGDVKYMWKQNFKLDLILPNFENIRVGRCDNFISLMPPSASFQNLTSLEVYECDSLEHIGTFFMAKNLVKLEHLRIYRCEKIVEILGNHGDVTGDKILFSNLKSLSLENLPSLTSFCTQNFTLEFPSLEKLNVYICRNMKIFSQGDLTTPKLLEVKIDFKSVELCPDVDVNTAIQQFHEQYTVED